MSTEASVPTVLDIAGVEATHRHFGRSLPPLIDGSATQHREFAFSEGGFRPELYDRANDVNEAHNIIGGADLADVESRLHTAMLHWLTDTSAPLPAHAQPRLPQVDLPALDEHGELTCSLFPRSAVKRTSGSAGLRSAAGTGRAWCAPGRRLPSQVRTAR